MPKSHRVSAQTPHGHTRHQITGLSVSTTVPVPIRGTEVSVWLQHPLVSVVLLRGHMLSLSHPLICRTVVRERQAPQIHHFQHQAATPLGPVSVPPTTTPVLQREICQAAVPAIQSPRLHEPLLPVLEVEMCSGAGHLRPIRTFPKLPVSWVRQDRQR